MKCPGQDTRYWKHDAIFDVPCPHCGAAIEFFKDQTSTRCRGCGKQVVNPKMDFGCASYCQYAEQCLGELPPELLAQRDDLLKDRVAIRMKQYFQRDFKRVGRATKVARYAERLARETGANPAVVLCAAYLHNIGAKTADAETGTPPAGTAAVEAENPTVARKIMAALQAKDALIDDVIGIIDHLSRPGDRESPEFACVHDALRLTKLVERHKTEPVTPEEFARHETAWFLTEAGRELARKTLLPA
ncbi:MAG: HD domain-containing protein [Deltaproteobacteria bacterium]|nr:HD domain-containing protein [Candidatus Anaeroferrophillacea bacterium]